MYNEIYIQKSDWIQDFKQKGYFSWTYRNDPKFLDRQVWANRVDPDQTAPSKV